MSDIGLTKFRRASFLDSHVGIIPAEAHYPGKESLYAPLMGSRFQIKLHSDRGLRVICPFRTTADVRALAQLSDAATTDPFAGPTALQLSTSAPGTYSVVQATALGTAIDISTGVMRLWTKNISGTAVLTAMSVDFFSAGTPAAPGGNYTSMNISVANGYGVGGGDGNHWWSFGSSMATATVVTGTGATMTAIKFIRINFSAGSSTPMVIQLGAIHWLPNLLTKAAAILCFDDTTVDQWNYAHNAMMAYGFRGVLYPSPFGASVGKDATFLSLQQMRSLHDHHRWQIASQDWSSVASGNEAAGLFSHLTDTRIAQAALGFTGGNDNSYPGGTTDAGITGARYELMKIFARTARTFTGGSAGAAPFGHAETFPFGDPMIVRGLNAQTYNDGTNGTRMQQHVDQAITALGVAVFIWHNGLANAGNYRTGFDSLLTYLDANRATVEVLTFQDLAP